MVDTRSSKKLSMSHQPLQSVVTDDEVSSLSATSASLSQSVAETDRSPAPRVERENLSTVAVASAAPESFAATPITSPTLVSAGATPPSLFGVGTSSSSSSSSSLSSFQGSASEGRARTPNPLVLDFATCAELTIDSSSPPAPVEAPLPSADAIEVATWLCFYLDGEFERTVPSASSEMKTKFHAVAAKRILMAGSQLRVLLSYIPVEAHALVSSMPSKVVGAYPAAAKALQENIALLASLHEAPAVASHTATARTSEPVIFLDSQTNQILGRQLQATAEHPQITRHAWAQSALAYVEMTAASPQQAEAVLSLAVPTYHPQMPPGGYKDQRARETHQAQVLNQAVHGGMENIEDDLCAWDRLIDSSLASMPLDLALRQFEGQSKYMGMDPDSPLSQWIFLRRLGIASHPETRNALAAYHRKKKASAPAAVDKHPSEWRYQDIVQMPSSLKELKDVLVAASSRIPGLTTPRSAVMTELIFTSQLTVGSSTGTSSSASSAASGGDAPFRTTGFGPAAATSHTTPSRDAAQNREEVWEAGFKKVCKWCAAVGKWELHTHESCSRRAQLQEAFEVAKTAAQPQPVVPRK